MWKVIEFAVDKVFVPICLIAIMVWSGVYIFAN
jgi:hypothetical protein